MAHLEKMTLSGVRSFNPEERQWIKFQPLTLILGVNGAGKTTLIEALRYVTSGEFPPGSNGGKLWIHDPLLQKSGGKVKAQVKLQFRTSDGVKNVVTRSLEMTTKKSSAKSGVTQTLKTIDSTIKRDKSSVGSRCLDMTKEMLSLLNVSKAVLTNVVFCHQEDNCWPLSEGKVLKEKFDQIFGSVQYVKSLAKIKKTREDHVKMLKAQEAHKATFDEIASTKSKYESRQKKLEKEIENLRKDKTAREKQLEPIDSEITGITRKEGELNQVISEISKIEGQLKEKKSSHVWLEETLGSFEEKTVEEVETRKEEFEKCYREQALGHRNLKAEIAAIDEEIKKCNSCHSKSESRKGTLKFQLQQNARNSAKREEAIASARSVVTDAASDCDDIDVLKKLLNEEVQKISLEEDERDPALVELEEKVRKHETEKKLILKEIDMKQKDQAKRDLELTHLTAELTKIESPAAEILKDTNSISEELQPIRDKVDESQLFESIDCILERIRLNHFDLDEAITNLKRSYKQLSKESLSSVSELRRKLRAEEDELKKSKVQLDKLNQEKISKRNQIRGKKISLSNCLNALAGCSSDYVAPSDIESQLAEIEREQEVNSSKIKKLEGERRDLETQKSNLERDAAGHELSMRQFADKIQYLKLTNEISGLSEKLSEKKKLHGVIDVSALQKKKKELNDRRCKIVNEIGSVRGKIEQMYSELKSIESELRQKKYITCEKDLKKAAIDLLTTDLLCKDLNTYYRVLDKAITTFHLRQMHSINQLIAHFWHITYQGGDIETVKIACDEEQDRTADAKRRNYNYRVVMVKNGIEFDMRGRCSAGQKVLASLVIRIALAQIFCKNCSILALDEPTTNLDKRNIEFLARAIKDVVEDQKGKLQILIITHDEEFLRYIDSEYGDKYFEVVKENGYSTIHVRNMSQRE